MLRESVFRAGAGLCVVLAALLGLSAFEVGLDGGVPVLEGAVAALVVAALFGQASREARRARRALLALGEPESAPPPSDRR